MMNAINATLVVEDAVYYGAGAFALWRGRTPEKAVAAVLLLDNTLSFFIQNPHQLSGPRFVSLAMDVGVLAVILYFAFTTNRRWPLLASALQILSTLTYVARIIDPTVGAWAYLTVDIVIGFALMATVAYGALDPPRTRWLHLIREKRI